MPKANDEDADFLATLGRQRQELLHRAGLVLGSADGDGDGDGDGDDATAKSASHDGKKVPQLSQLLLASLEVLKVAEEEIRERGTQAEYNRSLFDLAPAALLLTTTAGLIQTANRAAETLLLRDVYHLDGQSIPALVPKQARDAFKKQLGLLSVTSGASNWRFTIERLTHLPIVVLAAVAVVPSAMLGMTCLYWHLRADEPLPEAI